MLGQVHGSAPDIAGQDLANPMAMVLSAAMMCRYGLNLPEVRLLNVLLCQGSTTCLAFSSFAHGSHVPSSRAEKLRLCLFQ